MIVDQVQLYLKSGNGGEGANCLEQLSARRTIGGGGNGGEGGDIIFNVDQHLYDLSKFGMKKRYIAENGVRGKEHNKYGKNAKSLWLGVPRGTIIKDLSGKIITDLVEYKKDFLICKGGRGGEGNHRRGYVIPAQEGVSKDIILDYRIFNDVAIIGFPNSGKTSLFNALTHKSYKVASYPFTTGSCVWGNFFDEDYRDISILDTPPVKKDTIDKERQARFLKQLYRSKVILCLSDNEDEARGEFDALRGIIKDFDGEIIKNKKIFYLLTKIDRIDNTNKINGGDDVFAVSVDKGIGLEELKKKIQECLNK
ncbi:MAG: GTPase [Candidatus Omnitrophota bacterium]